MRNLSIRKATISDMQTVQSFDQKLFIYEQVKDQLINNSWPYSEEGKNWLTNIITSPYAICLLAEEEGKIIGFLTGMALAYDNKRPGIRTQLLNIYIETGKRKQGIGKQLVDAFITWSKKMNAQRMLVSSAAWNSEAISFYKKNYFTPYQVLLEKKLD